MIQLNTYLTFSGNCREAMTFYAECLDGDLIIQTIGDSPVADQMPPKMKECILHSSLTKGPVLLMGTDCVPAPSLIRGNSMSICIHCSSENEIRELYAKLSAGGQATHPVADSFWGAMFGDLTDKFGNQWILNFQKDQTLQ